MPTSGRALVLVCAHMEGGGRYYTPLLTGTTVLDICPVFVFCICLCLAKDICRMIALGICSFNWAYYYTSGSTGTTMLPDHICQLFVFCI